MLYLGRAWEEKRVVEGHLYSAQSARGGFPHCLMVGCCFAGSSNDSVQPITTHSTDYRTVQYAAVVAMSFSINHGQSQRFPCSSANLLTASPPVDLDLGMQDPYSTS